ncbi:hypothetical protein [Aegicerativicinus sediminis]|uniref:hypothetical protein n=1 Tax=Aegicerativicinus sediminis TaxID=2893202 RepID=UPI001E45E036|nr:hypothetical protein [Aegicerativicinus sediminis]
MKKIFSSIFCFLCFIFLSPDSLIAQDTHYWSQQFGTRTALLSGAVIGGADDNTMIYYNPAGLANLENSTISVNANAYRIENIKIFNALGDEADFKSSNLGSVPLLASGMINLKNEKWKLGYGFMAPVDFKFKGIARVDGNYNIIEDATSPGSEELVGESGLSSRLNEVLFAVGLGRVINENFSIGLSNLITVRSQDYARNFSTYVFLNDIEETFVGGNLTQNVEYYNIRYALKLGAIYSMKNWSFGATITSPSLNIGGKGTVAANIVAKNIQLSENGSPQSGVATDRQGELKTTFKSPFTFGAGVNYDNGKSYLGLSINYFAGIDGYDIMDIAPNTFVRPADLAPQLTSDQFMSVRSAAKSVMNVAIGYEYRLTDSVSLLASARNDMSYFDKELLGSGIRTTISSWDIFHFTTGVTINRNNSNLSLGLLFSAGTSENYQQTGNLNNPSSSSLLDGVTSITKANYSSLGILFGYTFYFKKF